MLALFPAGTIIKVPQGTNQNVENCEILFIYDLVYKNTNKIARQRISKVYQVNSQVFGIRFDEVDLYCVSYYC